MKKLLCVMVLAAFAGTAFASNDAASTGSIPQYQPNRILTQVGYFPLNHSLYCVGVGCDDEYLWVSNGTELWFTLFDEYGNQIDQGPQGGGASGWGERDMAWTGEYMFCSYSNLVDGYTYAGAGVFPFEGFFVGAPINPNRAMAYDGMSFYTAGFGTNLYKMDWNGTFGSSATITDLGGPWDAAYGLAYDCGWDCLWMTTASSAGYGVHQIDRTGFHINTYLDPAHPLYGGCTMMNTTQYGYVLVALVQETPDGLVFYDMESTGPSPVESASWGQIKALF